MEFRLTYRGPLRANAGPADKQAIRRVLHGQMRLLWEQHPLLDYQGYLTDQPEQEAIGVIQGVGKFRLAPLVTERLNLTAELDITFLRPEAPGALLTQGGDIDNRLKTLFDALRMPRVPNEIPVGDAPRKGEDPLFCLLEDDNLVTSVAVTTDRLLEAVENPAEVLLVIHVRTRGTKVTYGNIGLL